MKTSSHFQVQAQGQVPRPAVRPRVPLRRVGLRGRDPRQVPPDRGQRSHRGRRRLRRRLRRGGRGGGLVGGPGVQRGVQLSGGEAAEKDN